MLATLCSGKGRGRPTVSPPAKTPAEQSRTCLVCELLVHSQCFMTDPPATTLLPLPHLPPPFFRTCAWLEHGERLPCGVYRGVARSAVRRVPRCSVLNKHLPAGLLSSKLCPPTQERSRGAALSLSPGSRLIYKSTLNSARFDQLPTSSSQASSSQARCARYSGAVRSDAGQQSIAHSYPDDSGLQPSETLIQPPVSLFGSRLDVCKDSQRPRAKSAVFEDRPRLPRLVQEPPGRGADGSLCRSPVSRRLRGEGVSCSMI
ncbi:unnamed protein product [Gadus morhua 'NCC']